MTSALWRMSASPWPYAGWGAAVLCGAAASIYAAPGSTGAFGAALAIIMMAIAAIDARRFLIPDPLVLAGLLLGLAAAAFDRAGSVAAALGDAALRGIVLASLLLAFRAAYRAIRGREGIGLGDVKLAGMAGVWLSWMGVAVAIDIAALAALAVVALHAVRGRRITGATAIPFGLFFAPAIWVAWLFEAVSPRLLG